MASPKATWAPSEVVNQEPAPLGVSASPTTEAELCAETHRSTHSGGELLEGPREPLREMTGSFAFIRNRVHGSHQPGHSVGELRSCGTYLVSLISHACFPPHLGIHLTVQKPVQIVP